MSLAHTEKIEVLKATAAITEKAVGTALIGTREELAQAIEAIYNKLRELVEKT